MGTASTPPGTVERSVRTMMPLIGAFALGIGACAPTAQSPLSRPDVDRNVSVSTNMERSEHTIRRSDFVAVNDVAAPRPVVWQLLRQAWDDVGLPAPQVDDRAYSLGVSNHLITRRLGRAPLSTYLSCGSSVAGWNADTHRIRLTVRTVLEHVTPDSTRIHTRVDAVATPTEGTSSAAIECTTRGALEVQISARVRERLGLSR
jgi:hypothetical protein